jgi:branched-chain amino acid transport system substrate-binding protein
MDRRTAVSYMLAGALALVALSAEAAEPIKIGVTAPLTGPNAESGRNQIQAANLQHAP